MIGLLLKASSATSTAMRAILTALCSTTVNPSAWRNWGATSLVLPRARFSVAMALARAGRFADAREYTRAALRNFETFGARAATEIEEVRQILVEIDEAEGQQAKTPE